jgi:hypothetical protein
MDGRRVKRFLLCFVPLCSLFRRADAKMFFVLLRISPVPYGCGGAPSPALRLYGRRLRSCMIRTSMSKASVSAPERSALGSSGIVGIGLFGCAHEHLVVPRDDEKPACIHRFGVNRRLRRAGNCGKPMCDPRNPPRSRFDPRPEEESTNWQLRRFR